MTNNRKVVLVGTGFVGMSMAYSLENQGGINELVLIDVLKEKAEGEAMDLAHGLSCAPSRIDIKSGDYDECKDANDKKPPEHKHGKDQRDDHRNRRIYQFQKGTWIRIHGHQKTEKGNKGRYSGKEWLMV